MGSKINFLLLLCSLMVSALSKAPLVTSKEGTTWKSWQNPKYRLPRNLLPTTYAIRLLPFLEENDFTIDGHVDIFMNCVSSTNEITVNSRNISFDISNISVLDLETNKLLNVSNFVDEQATIQMITVKTTEQLTIGKIYKLSIPFTSLLNDQSQGFYRASYVENGVVKYMAITHMEPADARLAFPCFDEPDMKAKFSIVLGRKESMVTFSNMPLLSSNPNRNLPGYYWDYYETSVDMSTYLIALMVSEFSVTSSDTALSNVPFGVITRPEVQNLTEYAVEIGPRFLEFFEDYFGVDYTLAKMDMVAATDFPAGAMENWGLMIFHEEFILCDEVRSSSWNKQLVAEVISHELVHQWFGNLVTMKWWDNIWLNEGFARYLQNLAVEAVGPEFKIGLQFPVEYLQPAMTVDSLNSSHPMSAPETLDDIFDQIEYDKGASVLRMCADFVGEATFRKGLNRYLTAHKFENTVEADIWQSLNEQVIEDGISLPARVDEIMQSWTQEKNYPLVTVHRNYDDGTIHFEQERFVLDVNGQLTSLPERSYLWWVPLTFTQSFEDQTNRGWLSKADEVLPINLTVDRWVVFNVDQMGFYRVLYDDRNYALISHQLLEDHTQISAVNRAQLVDDSLNLAAAGVLSYVTALNLVRFLSSETEYYAWFGALDEIDYIDTMLYNQQINPDWKKFLTGLVEPFYVHIGFDETQSDDHMVYMSRTLISRWACRLGVEDCVNHASDEFAALMNNPSIVTPPNQRETILRTGVEYGGRIEWDFAFQQYRDKGSLEYLIAMTFSKQSDLIYRLLDEMVSPDSAIDKNDVDPMFESLASNSLGNFIAVTYLDTHWNAIEQALGANYLPRFFKYLCRIANTQAQKDKLLKLRNSHPNVLDGSEEVREGLVTVDKNLFWVEKYLEEITYFLVGPQTESTISTKETTAELTTTTTKTPEPSSANILETKWILTILSTLLLRAAS